MGMMRYMKIEGVVNLYATCLALEEQEAEVEDVGRQAYRPTWPVWRSHVQDWCGGPELRITHLTESSRISDRLKEIILANYAAIGAGVTCEVTGDGVRAVHAVVSRVK